MIRETIEILKFKNCYYEIIKIRDPEAKKIQKLNFVIIKLLNSEILTLMIRTPSKFRIE